MPAYAGQPTPREPTPLRYVTNASGETVPVLGDVEQRWYTQSLAAYLQQNRFTETTDLRDLDRLLTLELMVFRWSHWLQGDQDYDGMAIDEEKIRKNIKEANVSLNSLKENMGLTKKSRDDAANSGDFSKWFTNLLQRAKVFGVHRDNQLQRALVLMNELSAIVGTYDRSDQEEREKLGFKTEKDIVCWVRDTMLPEFKAIDEHFLENEQRMWQEDSPGESS